MTLDLISQSLRSMNARSLLEQVQQRHKQLSRMCSPLCFCFGLLPSPSFHDLPIDPLPTLALLGL